MYELGEPFPDVAVPPGTNLLVSGPPMTGKRRLAFDVLAAGQRRGEGVIVVTTKDDADRVREEFGRRSSGDGPLGIVDCVTRQQGMGGVEDEELVRYASSPVDLTGIGIELSELLRSFYQERDRQQNRVLLDSLSTLLMYSDLQTVFRFLHVFTGRVQSADGLGLYVLDSTAHDEKTMSTLKQLFDGVVELRETDDGDVERRLVGLSDVDSAWRAQ
ncbi:MAG: RAD55 family ATPase [Halobacteriaceae archaeon]